MAKAIKRDWWATYEAANPVPPQSIDHFRSIDWCRNAVDDPAYVAIPSFSRTLKSDGEDFYFAKTIATPNTLAHFLCLMRKDLGLIDDGYGAETLRAAQRIRKEPWTPPAQPDMTCLISAGSGALDGHPQVMHGGVCCAILDESQGLLIMAMIRLVDGFGDRKTSAYTGNLNVAYRAPVATPGDLMVKTWVVAREGKKWMTRAQIVDKNGTVCTEGEALWILVPRQKL